MSLPRPRPRRRARITMLLLAGAVVDASGIATAYESSLAGWNEISWPFPRDAWEPGRAFVCTSEECGGEIELYVRPKIGFCNCTTGISDDDEVDRVTDLDLIDPQFKPLDDGKPVQAAGMQGRVRHYIGRSRNGGILTLLGIALSRKCDVIVAVAQSRSSDRRDEQIAFGLLSSPPIWRWIEAGFDARR
jgi:hypothetical protein